MGGRAIQGGAITILAEATMDLVSTSSQVHIQILFMCYSPPSAQKRVYLTQGVRLSSVTNAR